MGQEPQSLAWISYVSLSYVTGPVPTPATGETEPRRAGSPPPAAPKAWLRMPCCYFSFLPSGIQGVRGAVQPESWRPS